MFGQVSAHPQCQATLFSVAKEPSPNAPTWYILGDSGNPVGIINSIFSLFLPPPPPLPSVLVSTQSNGLHEGIFIRVSLNLVPVCSPILYSPQPLLPFFSAQYFSPIILHSDFLSYILYYPSLAHLTLNTFFSPHNLCFHHTHIRTHTQPIYT